MQGKKTFLAVYVLLLFGVVAVAVPRIAAVPRFAGAGLDCRRTAQELLREEVDELFTVKSIPQVYLTAELEVPDRNDYSSVTVRVTDDVNSDNDTGVLSGGIRARGNSTYELGLLYGGPMPYKIKLDEKRDLLGMGEHKKWNLIANFYDRSYVKQFIAFGAASVIYGQNKYYQPKAKFVEVFYNGDYRGLYLLTESIEEDDGALDIEVDVAGYGEVVPFLLEMEYYMSINEYYARDKEKLREHFGADMFYASGDVDVPFWLLDDDVSNDEVMFPQPYVLKYPKTFQDVSSVQADNIVNSVRTLYSDVANGAALEALDIDAQSFASAWVFCELFANSSCYHGPSAYIYRKPDSSKIYSGPLWDFDTALINRWMDEEFFYPVDRSNVLIDGLLKNAEFGKLIAVRYRDVYENILPLMEEKIVALKSNVVLKEAVMRAEAKYDSWHLRLNRPSSVFVTPDYPDERVLAIDSYEGHIDYILEVIYGGSDDGRVGRAEWFYRNLDNWGGG